MMERLICIVIGYACGLLQTSYLYGKAHGIDIREHGSGNAGTTNALRTLGTKAGVITFIVDCLKCMVAVLLVQLIFGKDHTEYIRLLRLYGAFGAILGHNFPFYLKFKGGKGIACTAGLLASYHIPLGLVALAVFVIVFVTTHYVSLGSLLINLVFFFGTLYLGMSGAFNMAPALLTEMYILAGIICAMAFWKHRANIVRLATGTENKTYLGKKKE